MDLKYNQYILQKVNETYHKHLNITKEIHNCTKTSEPTSKENDTEHFDFDIYNR